MHKIRILVLIDYYLPGYKAGGPIRTLTNMVECLQEKYEFLIVTRDRDLGDKQAYPNIKTNVWVTEDTTSIYYISEERWGIRSMFRLLTNTQYDILYLNSFFSVRSTILPLLLRYIGVVPRLPVVIAPRGEFSPGALRLKPVKKRVYLAILRVLGLYRNLVWQASSVEEADDIEKLGIAVDGKTIIAPDLVFGKKPVCVPTAIKRLPGKLRLVFVSRISPKKNLDFLLRTLEKTKSGITLAIFGPVEDSFYWEKCKNLISSLPPNIEVTYGGSVPHEKIYEVFSQNDLFAFPTYGENFGHIIFEALSSDTPVLTSDQTPWKPDLEGALTTLPLSEEQWSEAIETWACLSSSDLLSRRYAAREYTNAYLRNDDSLVKNIELFQGTIHASESM